MGTRRVQCYGKPYELTLFFRKPSPFSNHHPAEFTSSASINSPDEYRFFCSEQFYMFNKATYFQDFETARKIINARSAREMKRMGGNGSIIGFKKMKWDEVKESVMMVGLLEKFRQNIHLRFNLFVTLGSRLVECSPMDNYWGIGRGIQEPEAANEQKWRGKNRLGELLGKVRDALLQEADFSDEVQYIQQCFAADPAYGSKVCAKYDMIYKERAVTRYWMRSGEQPWEGPSTIDEEALTLIPQWALPPPLEMENAHILASPLFIDDSGDGVPATATAAEGRKSLPAKLTDENAPAKPQRPPAPKSSVVPKAPPKLFLPPQRYRKRVVLGRRQSGRVDEGRRRRRRSTSAESRSSSSSGSDEERRKRRKHRRSSPKSRRSHHKRKRSRTYSRSPSPKRRSEKRRGRRSSSSSSGSDSEDEKRVASRRRGESPSPKRRKESSSPKRRREARSPSAGEKEIDNLLKRSPKFEEDVKNESIERQLREKLEDERHKKLEESASLEKEKEIAERLKAKIEARKAQEGEETKTEASTSSEAPAFKKSARERKSERRSLSYSSDSDSENDRKRRKEKKREKEKKRDRERDRDRRREKDRRRDREEREDREDRRPEFKRRSRPDSLPPMVKKVATSPLSAKMEKSPPTPKEPLDEKEVKKNKFMNSLFNKLRK